MSWYSSGNNRHLKNKRPLFYFLTQLLCDDVLKTQCTQGWWDRVHPTSSPAGKAFATCHFLCVKSINNQQHIVICTNIVKPKWDRTSCPWHFCSSSLLQLIFSVVCVNFTSFHTPDKLVTAIAEPPTHYRIQSAWYGVVWIVLKFFAQVFTPHCSNCWMWFK